MTKPRFLKTSVWSLAILRWYAKDRVLAGPFRSMKLEAERGYYYLGTYEKELTPAVARLLKIEFERVLVAGAAEGYYAAGFALFGRAQSVIAYEAKESLHPQLLRNMELNGSSGKVSIRGDCTPSVLSRDLIPGASLLVVDVEGYETELLDLDAVPALRTSTILMEAHGLEPDSTDRIIVPRFETTHEIEVFRSVPRSAADLRHAPWLLRPIFRMHVSERRRGDAKWLLLTPRH